MGGRTRRSTVGVVDLARELGVSTATVSRALNGSAAVRPELAERIRQHAAEQGYVPNRLARGLSASISRAFVGFVIPYVDTPAYSGVAAECSRLLSTGGTQMILTVTQNEPERELQQLRELVASRIAGLIIAPSTGVLEESRAILRGLPVVELHRSCDVGAPGVFADDEGVMGDAVTHLVELGHTDIAYLGTPKALSHGAMRLRAVSGALERAGLDPARMRVRLVEPNRENGRLGVHELLDGPTRPTALVVGGGALSVGAAEAVRARGLRLPDDLSLVVYGDPAWFSLSDPPLTAVSVPYDRLASEAATLLSGLLDGADVEAVPHLLAPPLRVAGSTGPPPAT